MVPLNILSTGFRAVLMRSHAVKYAACVVLACAAAVVLAMPVFGQRVTVMLVGAGDTANCTRNKDEATAKLLGSSLRSLTPDDTLPPLSRARVIALGDNAYPSGTRAQFAKVKSRGPCKRVAAQNVLSRYSFLSLRSRLPPLLVRGRVYSELSS